jgi:hypothetical protein
MHPTHCKNLGKQAQWIGPSCLCCSVAGAELSLLCVICLRLPVSVCSNAGRERPDYRGQQELAVFV